MAGAASFAAAEAGGGPAGGLVEPGGEQRVAEESGGLAREIGEDHLGYLPGAVRIAAGAAERGRIHEVDVAGDEALEGVVGIFFDEGAQEPGVIHGGGSQAYSRRERDRTGIFWGAGAS